MPYVELKDGTQLFYQQQPTVFAPERPLILMLHPLFMDQSRLAPILADHEIEEHFNVVCFDQRSHGLTKNEPNVLTDFATQAADFALAMDALKLPVAHIVTNGAIAGKVGLYLCLLFPDRFLSLSILGSYPFFSYPTNFEQYQSFVDHWAFPEDDDDIEDAADALVHWYYHDKLDAHTRDEWIDNLHRRYPPHSMNSFELAAAFMYKLPCLHDYDVTRRLKVPVLLCQGMEDLCATPQQVEMFEEIIAEVVPVQAHFFASIGHLPSLEAAHEVHPLLVEFLLANEPKDIHARHKPFDFKHALAQIAEMDQNPSVLARDPMLPLSYSRVRDAMVQTRQQFFDELKETAENPVLSAPAPRADQRDSPKHKIDWATIQLGHTDHEILEHVHDEHHHVDHPHFVHGTQTKNTSMKIWGTKLLNIFHKMTLN